MSFKRLLGFAKILEDEFSDIIENIELHLDKLRITLIDKSWIEVRYPVENKFSFHWQRGREVYRIDTAPHYRHVRTFPRHFYFGSEDKVIEDFITKGTSPEEDLRAFMNWVRGQLFK